jgi:hypothetical protein
MSWQSSLSKISDDLQFNILRSIKLYIWIPAQLIPLASRYKQARLSLFWYNFSQPRVLSQKCLNAPD